MNLNCITLVLAFPPEGTLQSLGKMTYAFVEIGLHNERMRAQHKLLGYVNCGLYRKKENPIKFTERKTMVYSHLPFLFCRLEHV